MCEKGEKVSVKINLTRLKKNIEELAKFGVLETGGIALEGNAARLQANEHVRKAYLGVV